MRFTHTATVEITCTTNADVTLTVSHNSTIQHSTVLAVTCVPPVEISNYVPGDRTGAGAMSGSFEVTPAAAECTVSNAWGVSGVPFAGGTGTGRHREHHHD